MFSLFTECFHRPFPEPVWQRLYASNPHGLPGLVVAYDQDKMVAHNALIPGLLQNEKGESLEYLLMITAMIHPDYRGGQTIRQKVGLANKFLQKSGRDFILGYPNASFYPILKRLFHWQDIHVSELLDWFPEPGETPSWSAKTLEDWRLGTGWCPPSDLAFRSWRCDEGQYEALEIPDLKLISRRQGEQLNILDLEVTGVAALSSLQGLLTQRGLQRATLTRFHADSLGLSKDDLKSHGDYVLRMCMSETKQNFEKSKFRLNLLSSDVF